MTEDLESGLQDRIFSSFSIDDTEFAISVRAIKEVVNEPQFYQSMPLSPNFLLGLFNLRGMVVPVVDLRIVFGLTGKKKYPDGQRKIAIVEYGQHCIGVVFDNTGEVFSAKDDERADFQKRDETPQDHLVKGVFKLDEGKRIIQILDPYEILHLEKIPRTESTSQHHKKVLGKKLQCISFLVENSVCAIGIDSIQEILKIEKIENSALANELCLGAIDLRGSTIPVIDLAVLLKYRLADSPDDHFFSTKKIIVMKHGRNLFGLLVDSVENIVSYYKDDLVDFPVLGEQKKEIFQGCIISQDQIETILLNHENLLTHAEVERITRGHSKLYEDQHEGHESVTDGLSKKTYITFSLENRYALEISEVKEVLNFPEELIRPPHLAKCFKGMLSLRGELIPIIDPRLLYNEENKAYAGKSKILIFDFREARYGLMVDTVDSIMSFSEKDTVELPEIMFRGRPGGLSEGVRQAIQVTNVDGSTATLLVLGLPSICSRIESGRAA